MVEVFNFFIKLLNYMSFLMANYFAFVADSFLSFFMMEEMLVNVASQATDSYIYFWYFISFCMFMLQMIKLTTSFWINKPLIFSFRKLVNAFVKWSFYFAGYAKYIGWYLFWNSVTYMYNNYMYKYMYFPENYEMDEYETRMFLWSDLSFFFMLMYFFPKVLFSYFIQWVLKVFDRGLNMEMMTLFYLFVYILSSMISELLYFMLHFKTVFDNSMGEASTMYHRHRSITNSHFWVFWNFLNTNLNRLYHFFPSKLLKEFMLLMLNFFIFIIFYFLFLIFSYFFKAFHCFNFHTFLFSSNKMAFMLNKFSKLFKSKIFRFLNKVLFIFIYCLGYLVFSLFDMMYMFFSFMLNLFIFIVKLFVLWLILAFMYYFLKLDYMFSGDMYNYFSTYICNLGLITNLLLNLNDYFNFNNLSYFDIRDWSKSKLQSIYYDIYYYKAMSESWIFVSMEWASRWFPAYVSYSMVKFVAMHYYKYVVVMQYYKSFYYMAFAPSPIYMYFLANHVWLYYFYYLIILMDYIFMQCSMNWFTFVLFKCLYIFYDFSALVENIASFISSIFFLIPDLLFFFFHSCYKILATFLKSVTPKFLMWCLTFVFHMGMLDWLIYFDTILKMMYYFLLHSFYSTGFMVYYYPFLSDIYSDMTCLLFFYSVVEYFNNFYFSMDFINNYFGLFPKLYDFNFFYKNKSSWVKMIHSFKTALSFNYFAFSSFKIYEFYAFNFNVTGNKFFNNMSGVVMIEFLIKLCLMSIICWFIFPKSFGNFLSFYSSYYRSPEYTWKAVLTNMNADTNEWVKGSLVEFLLPNYYNSMLESYFWESEKMKKEFSTWLSFKKIMAYRMIYAKKLDFDEKYKYMSEHMFWHVYNHSIPVLSNELETIWEFEFHKYLDVKDYSQMAKLYGENPKPMNSFMTHVDNDTIKSLYWSSPDLVEMDKHAHFYLNLMYPLNEKFHRFFDFMDQNIFNNYSPIWLYGMNNDIPTVTLIDHETSKDYWCGYDNDDPLLFEFFNAFLMAFFFFFTSMITYYWGYKSYVWDMYFMQEPWFLDLFLGEFTPFYHVSNDFWGFYFLLAGGTETMPSSKFTALSSLKFGYSYTYYLMTESLFSNNYFYNHFNTFTAFICYQLIHLFSFSYFNILMLMSIFVKFKFWKYLFVLSTKNMNDVMNMWGLISLYKNSKPDNFCW